MAPSTYSVLNWLYKVWFINYLKESISSIAAKKG